MMLRAHLKFVVLVGLAIGAPDARAQNNYPNETIHAITAFPPGSGADILARFIASKMQQAGGQSVIVENKVGAAGLIAAQFVARAKPDGYTLLLNAGNSVAANYSLFKNRPVNPAKDFLIAGTINRGPFMLVVPAASPHKTLPELTETLRKKGDRANYAEANTPGKVVGELYKAAMDIKANDIPYRTAADALNDLASGFIDFAVFEPVFSMNESRSGRLRILAVSTEKRLTALPDVPTMAESGVPGVDVSAWFAAIVPSATPPFVVNKINSWLKTIVSSEEAKAYLTRLGSEPWAATPEEGQALLIKNQKDWEEYIKIAKIEPQG